MSIKVLFEIGHEASLRAKPTIEGFTHDWELFVRGCDSNDISHFVDKVVFNLHESFPKPKRVIKDPPYSLQETGYAGFVLPIDIYFKNRDDPKRITFNYDLDLQQTGPAIVKTQKEKFIFNNPSDEFRRKLLKGGGIIVQPQSNILNNSSLDDNKSRDSIDNERSQLVNKPKFNTNNDQQNSKKHKQLRDDGKNQSTFANLFGTPITKGSNSSTGSNATNNLQVKASPDHKNKTSPNTSNKNINNNLNYDKIQLNHQKYLDKINATTPLTQSTSAIIKDNINNNNSSSSNNSNNSNNKEKLKHNKNVHSPHNNKERDKDNKKLLNDDKHDQAQQRRDDKKKDNKNYNKDRERSREKSSKRSSSPKRNYSNSNNNINNNSPKRINLSPQRTSSSVLNSNNNNNYAPSSSSSSSKKSKKERKEKLHDRDKDKGHKKDKDDSKLIINSNNNNNTNSNSGSRNSTKELTTNSNSNLTKEKMRMVSLDHSKTPIIPHHQQQQQQQPQQELDNIASSKYNHDVTKKYEKDKEIKDDRKHKHKKKDKNKKDEYKDKELQKDNKDKEKPIRNKEKLSKNVYNNNNSMISKNADVISSSSNASALIGTNVNISTTITSGLTLGPTTSVNTTINKTNNLTSILGELSDHDSHDSIINNNTNSEPIKPEKIVKKSREKTTKQQQKDNNESVKEKEVTDKKRKRKNKESQQPLIVEQPPMKIIKNITNNNNDDDNFINNNINKNLNAGQNIPSTSNINQTVTTPSSSMGTTGGATATTSNTNNFNAITNSSSQILSQQQLQQQQQHLISNLPIDYMTELKELQNKIMTLDNNNELQQVVEIIAATGCYEVTNKTFDFDLCALDRLTVKRLQDFFSIQL